jgi:hypothetical protein
VSRRVLPLILVALLGGALAGCADGDVKAANAYVEAVNDAQQSFAERSEQLRTRLADAQPTKQGKAALQDFYDAVDDFAAQLRDIDPPADVESLHARLIAAVVRFGGSLRKAGNDIASGNAGQILDGQQELSAATAAVGRRINATINAINDALRD